MRRLKVYLDTSVVSHLMQEDVPAKMADTLQLWELFRKGIYEVYVSTVTLEEISARPGGCTTNHRYGNFVTKKL